MIFLRTLFLRHITPYLCVVAALSGIACNRPGGDASSVVVYTSHDQLYSEQIFRRFEEKTGIRIKAVYDTEATKTVGLANRLVAEALNPQCDVFWNNEIVRTIILKRKGVLERYTSPSSVDIPRASKDPEGFWTGFAARARVLILNTNMPIPRPVTASSPDDSHLSPEVRGSHYASTFSILSLKNPDWRSKVALAYPVFGTTSSHAAALFAALGDAEAKMFFTSLKLNDVLIVDGNAASKDAVARGEVPLGFTDTDDAYIAIQQGKPVRMIFPDQGNEQMGTLIIPNSVALIKGGPNPEAGRRFIDFLLSRETEEMLAKSGSGQMPVRTGISVPSNVPPLPSIKAMQIDWEEVADRVGDVSQFLNELFVR